MVTTRSQTNTTTTKTSLSCSNETSEVKPSTTTTTTSRAVLVEVMQDMLIDAQERAKRAEKELAVAEDKVKMLEYELMFVRNEHVNELLLFEKTSKNRQFYYLFWLSCAIFLQGINLYYCLCNSS